MNRGAGRLAFAGLVLILSLLCPLLCAHAADGPSKPRPEARLSTYSGNVKTGKYHNSSCRHFACKNCKVRFDSAEAARRQGYVACKLCGG